MNQYKEMGGLLLLLALGVGLRLAFAIRYPTIPISDFESLIAFGRLLHEQGALANEGFWEYFNPGLPLLLSMLFRFVPGDPTTIARLATAIACGFLPVIPFLIWRGVMPFWVRLLAGAALGVWRRRILTNLNSAKGAPGSSPRVLFWHLGREFFHLA